jgi:hypothetical protein
MPTSIALLIAFPGGVLLHQSGTPYTQTKMLQLTYVTLFEAKFVD